MSEALDLDRCPDGKYPVGWLGSSVPTSGPTPDECVERLFDAYAGGLRIPDGSLGWHNCEICTTGAEWYPGGQIGPVIRWRGQELRLYGHGHHLVQHEGRVYVCPALILHYILDHGYRPPDEFVRAVTQGRFLTRDPSVAHGGAGGEEKGTPSGTP
jgi:hypothetical protein